MTLLSVVRWKITALSQIHDNIVFLKLNFFRQYFCLFDLRNYFTFLRESNHGIASSVTSGTSKWQMNVIIGPIRELTLIKEDIHAQGQLLSSVSRLKQHPLCHMGVGEGLALLLRNMGSLIFGGK